MWKGLDTFSYQWIRVSGSDSDISGATASTYTLVAADEGNTVRVRVSFNDGAGNAESLTSDTYPSGGTVLPVTDATPPGAPRTLQARARDSAVSLSWQAPLDDGGRPPVRYEVRHAQGNTVPGNTAWDAVGQVLAYTVPNLTNGRQYTFEVRAVNTADRAGAAARVQATPEVNADAPSVVRNLRAVVRFGEVGVYWNTPARRGDSRIVRYEYRWVRGRAVAGAHWGPAAPLFWQRGQARRPAQRGRKYTFEVRAVNASGKTGAAAQVRATVSAQAERAPGAPRNLRAVSGQPSVRWSATGKRAYVT